MKTLRYIETEDKTRYIRSVIIDFSNRMSDELLLLYIAKIALYEIVDPTLHFKNSFPQQEGKIDMLEEIIRENNKDEIDSKKTIDFVRRASVTTPHA